jgi:thymidylate synthase (FAD)
MDPYLRVEVLSKTQNPNQIIYAAMHQDYSEGFVFDQVDKFPSEEQCGSIAVKRLLAGGRGHFGSIEHPSITFSTGYFPHSVMQQARTHRIGTSFDCQSLRYTSQNIVDVANSKKNVEEVFYLRPVGNYTDRQGKKYEYNTYQRQQDLEYCFEAARRYEIDLNRFGHSEEHARGKLPFDYRQHFVVSFNMRSLLHFLDLRYKKDAQLEIQWLCDLILPHFQQWSPQIYQWYCENRLSKAKLAP